MISELANQVEAEWEKQNIHAARASDRVANRLRFDILSGKLPAGCRLLPERRLAEVLNVSRVSVRSAIATLQSEQLLDVRRGSGITVMDYRRSSSIDLFTWLMAGKTLPIEQQFKIFSQVAMVRRRLALPTLLEAIDRAKPADIRRLEQLIQKQQENLDKPDAYLVVDLEISQCIARAADNVVVELLHNSLRRCMGARAELVMAFLGDLKLHVQNYAAILHAFSMGHELKNNPTLLSQISQTIEMFEDAALERVRQYLESQAEELVSDPSDQIQLAQV